MAWIGRKKIAFVPLSRPNAHPPDFIPPDWENDILRRVLYDPDPTTGKDKSLRAYIHTVSSGVADLDAIVTERHSVDLQDVPANILESEMGDAAACGRVRCGGDRDARRPWRGHKQWLLVPFCHARTRRHLGHGADAWSDRVHRYLPVRRRCGPTGPRDGPL